MPREGDLWEGYRVSLPGREKKYHSYPNGCLNGCGVGIVLTHRGGAYAAEERVCCEEDCGDLVAGVDRVGEEYAGQAGGGFYFNEYNQVLKPVWGDGHVELRYVGEFPDATFQFPTRAGVWTNRHQERPDVLGPPPAPGGGFLEPGDVWWGPRLGIPYWIQGDGTVRRPWGHYSEDDYVHYEDWDHLEDHSPPSQWHLLAREVLRRKGGQGGRFYVTEAGWVWAPFKAGAGKYNWSYTYVGLLWNLVEDWYPKSE